MQIITKNGERRTAFWNISKEYYVKRDKVRNTAAHFRRRKTLIELPLNASFLCVCVALGWC